MDGNDHEMLNLRSTGLAYVVLNETRTVMPSVVTEVKKLGASDSHLTKINFIVSYSLLYKVLEYILEDVLRDQLEREMFRGLLIQKYRQAYVVDPTPFLADFAGFVSAGHEGDEARYVGQRICEVLGFEDLRMVMQLSMIVSSHIIYGFYEICDRVWNESVSELREISAEYDQLCAG